MEFKIPLAQSHMTVELLLIMYNGIQCTEGASNETRQDLLQFVVEEYAKLHNIKPKAAEAKIKEDAGFVHESNIGKPPPVKAPKLVQLQTTSIESDCEVNSIWFVTKEDSVEKNGEVFQEKLYLGLSYNKKIIWGGIVNAIRYSSHNEAMEALVKYLGKFPLKIERFYEKIRWITNT